MSLALSIATDNVNFAPVEVENLEDVVRIKQENHVAPGLFKNNYRRRENFLGADFVAFDIDDTLDIEACQERLQSHNFSYCIIPSRSHKGGKPQRYHAFIPLEERITDVVKYEQTVKELLRLFPEADEKCKDASRCFYSSGKQKEVYKHIGTRFPVKAHLEVVGDIIEGGRNDSLFKTAVRLRNEGANHDEILQFLLERNKRCAPPLPEYEVLNIARSASTYEDNSEEEDLGLMSLEEVYQNKEQIEWLVDGLLTKGGISILAARPKCGKSTLVRQLCKGILMGTGFLGRETKQGPVVYLALEEQLPLLKEQYKALGVPSDAELYIRTKPLMGQDSMDFIEAAILAKKPQLLVIDTMNLVTKINDLNNYAEVSKMLEPFREVARRTGCHVLFIHHSNKNNEAVGTDVVMGSTGIRGAVDCIMVLEQSGGTDRRIISEQRGGRPFDNQRLMFDTESGTYTLSRLDASQLEF